MLILLLVQEGKINHEKGWLMADLQGTSRAKQNFLSQALMDELNSDSPSVGSMSKSQGDGKEMMVVFLFHLIDTSGKVTASAVKGLELQFLSPLHCKQTKLENSWQPSARSSHPLQIHNFVLESTSQQTPAKPIILQLGESQKVNRLYISSEGCSERSSVPQLRRSSQQAGFRGRGTAQCWPTPQTPAYCAKRRDTNIPLDKPGITQQRYEVTYVQWNITQSEKGREF